MEKYQELLRINEEIAELHVLDAWSEDEDARFEELDARRQSLEHELGDQVEGLKGYRGGPG
jgi:hypothetical protein